ncbi:hypothetical protein [Aureispira anguillae]|uniref:Outer membrane protein beta-barrel domain-containing protein n=1 Tax=Aureispira anguillae TaxID=2864201 RepID=A0A916DSM9_9BACT|nr:hypothetical protein [Aureispira anguillae]BDS11172.1 hypothetical protein AsAng_0018830 [Aureispira anguillae]
MKYIFLFLILLNVLHSKAQLRDSDNDPVFEAKFDLRMDGGISIPLGKYRLLTDESDDRSAANYGVYTELSASLTPLSTSPWRMGFSLGYIHNPFKAAHSKIQYNLPLFKGTNWNSFYGLLGIGFTSETTFFYSVRVGAGVMGYSGGNITKGSLTLDTMQVQTWKYKLSAAGVVQASFSIGYHFTSKFSMFATATIFYAAGVRKGTLLDEFFIVDSKNTPARPVLEQNITQIQNQTTIFTLNIGLGLKYKFYEAAEKIHYKFNIEKNE